MEEVAPARGAGTTVEQLLLLVLVIHIYLFITLISILELERLI